MILSVSRRTDIPAYYSEWFLNRLREGHALVRNPMNHAQISKIPLTPDAVDCIVFWTKNPASMFAKLDELDTMGYRYYFQFTLTPYGSDIEPGPQSKSEIAQTFRALAARLGPERLVWRYDPILLTGRYPIEWHAEQFAQLCEVLDGCTDTVIISLVDTYAKRKNPPYRAPNEAETACLCKSFLQSANAHHLAVSACCEAGLAQHGVGQAHCIDKTRIERICGGPLNLPADKNQRPGCGCFASVDIGAYGTCPAGCVYCYANRGPETAQRAFSSHDPRGPLLFGKLEPGESVHERPAVSHLLLPNEQCHIPRYFT